MLRRKLYSLGFLISTLVLLVSAVYAWFSIGPETNLEFLEVSVKSDVVESFLFVKKNDEDESLIQDPQDLVDILHLGVPSDDYRFRLRLRNYSSDSRTVNAMFKNMTNHGMVEGADIRDAYLLKDSKVYYGVEEIILTPNVPGTAIGYDGQTLKENRLNNFRDTSTNNMILVQNKTLLPGETLDVIFYISFDYDVYSSAYTGYVEIERLIVNIV
jgi:hypothetical protein